MLCQIGFRVRMRMFEQELTPVARGISGVTSHQNMSEELRAAMGLGKMESS